MQWEEIEGSHLTRVGYDDSISALYVVFDDGTEYRYDSVPRVLYDGLLASESRGKFLHAHIKSGGFPYARVQ